MIITRKNGVWNLPMHRPTYKNLDQLFNALYRGNSAVKNFSVFRDAAKLYRSGKICRDNFISQITFW